MLLNISCSSPELQKKKQLNVMNLQGDVKLLTEVVFKAGFVADQVSSVEKIRETQIEFNTLGYKIKESNINESGELLSYINFVSDSFGILEKEVEFQKNIFTSSEDFDTISIVYYKNDINGNATEINRVSQSNTFIYSIKNKYDTNGNILESQEYDENQIPQYKWVFKYKNNVKYEENQFKPNGTLNFRFTIKTDRSKNIVERTTFNEYDHLVEKLINKYEYDEIGNWKSKITFINDQPIEISERKIEYFN